MLGQYDCGMSKKKRTILYPFEDHVKVSLKLTVDLGVQPSLPRHYTGDDPIN